MNNGRFYSRRQGWCCKEILNTIDNCVKYYYSGILDKLPNIDLNDKDGKYILNYLKKNNLENEYKELYTKSKIYSNWYFYYNENINIFSSESL